MGMLWRSAFRMRGLVGAITVLCVTSGFTCIAAASESSHNQFLIAQADNPAPATYDVPGEERVTTRGIFLAPLIPTIVQGLGSTLLNWFGRRLLTPSGQIQSSAPPGQIQSLTSTEQVQSPDSSAAGRPPQAPEPGVVSQPAAQVGTPVPQGDLQAGIAYEIYVQGPESQWIRVDPQTFVFATGQQFVVAYRPNLPGRVAVYNVNPRGQETAIDSKNVSGGQLATLGPYEFSGQKGDELLKIVLAPCVSPQMPVITGDIARVANAAVNALPFRLSQCTPETDAPRPVGTRDIKKVSMEGGIAFGLDKLSESELQTGNLTPRSLAIGLQHR